VNRRLRAAQTGEREMDGMMANVVVLVAAFKRAADSGKTVALVPESDCVKASTDPRDIHDDRHWRITPDGVVVAPMAR